MDKTLKDIITNIRTSQTDDAALRESLRVKGWDKNLPGIKDGSGTILVGNRRARLCKELGIPTAFVTVTGLDDEARLSTATASNIGGEGMSKADRKRIAEALYRIDSAVWTEQHIAEVLGVTQKTISKDLANLYHGINSRRAKTQTNPKGAGRPKGSGTKPRPRKTPEAASQTAASLVLDQGKTLEQAAAETGVGSVQVVKTAVAREEGRRQAQEEKVDVDALPKSHREQLEIYKRKLKREFDLEVEQKARERYVKALDDYLPELKKREEQANLIINKHRGFIPRATYKKIWTCLHPDSRNSVTEQRLQEAFIAFEKLERVLISGQEMPAPPSSMPRNWQEMQARREAKQRENSERSRKSAATRKAKVAAAPARR